MSSTENAGEKNFVELKDEVIKVVQTVFDPEIPVNIYELGLVYDIKVDAGNNVEIVMTLTSPACPVAESLPKEVEDKINALDGVKSVKLELTFEPAWEMSMMSEAAKLELNIE